MINSKAKGKRYELAIAHWLKEHFGDGRRGQQYQGTPESPDVICEALPGIHFECKHNNRLNLYQAVEQAVNDAGSLVPVVVHKHDNKPSLVTVRLDDLTRFATLITEGMNHDSGS